jgi:phage shock protein A
MEAESDLELIKECGFSSFDEVVQRINELVNIMRVGRIKAEKNLDRFQNQAKIYLKGGQRDKAKKELAKKKKKEEKIKTFDNQFNVILEKIKEVKNINQMQQVLNATKYCNNLLLAELSQEETGEPTEGVKEYQDLLENDKEITKYTEIIIAFKKKNTQPKPKPVNNFPSDNDMGYNFNQMNKPPSNDSYNNISSSELDLIRECGFNSFEEVVKKIYEFVKIMRAGRIKAEKNLDRYQNQAKNYLKEGQKDLAKKELIKKKKKEEKIKSLDTQFNVVLEKLNEVKNITQMQQVLNATKYCNKLLLAELSQEETGEPTEGVKEYQDLIENDKEITKYTKIIAKNNKGEYNNNQFANYPNDNIDNYNI